MTFSLRVLSIASLLMACGPDATTGPGSSTTDGTSSGRDVTDVSDTRPGSDTAPSGQACSQASDCPNLVCYCVTNPGDFPSPVNSRRCVDNACQTAAQSCADVCAGFGKTWNGQSETLPNTPEADTSSPSDTSAGSNSCEYAYDDECDDAEQGGTGYCPPGTDDADCS